MSQLHIDETMSKLAKEVLSFGNISSLDRDKTVQTEYSSPGINPTEIATDEHLANVIHNFTAMFEIIRDEPLHGRKVDAAKVIWRSLESGDYGYFKAVLYSKDG